MELLTFCERCDIISKDGKTKSEKLCSYVFGYANLVTPIWFTPII